jgi:glycosyltransferase involved in cell wall biosynthesis
MKVAMVSEHASPLSVLGGVDAGGQNVHVAALAGALAELGHEVVVYTRRDAVELPRRVRMSDRVVVDHLDAGPPCAVAKDDIVDHLPELAAELGVRLRHDRPDVLHAHFWMSGVASLTATRTVPVPVVQTFHALGVVKRRYQGVADTSPAMRLQAERMLARRCDRVIASSTDERAELRRLGADDARVDVIPSGVDLSLFTPDGPRFPRTTRYRLLTVARLVPRKGVDDAIRMLPLLPETELIIAGGPERIGLDDDAEACRLQALAMQLGVADRVLLLGSVPHAELAPWVRSADAVVCLPWYEPFGIVPLEAMACGVPVVASAVGGLLDTVLDGVTGVHVPARDPAAAAAAIRALLDDEPRRRRIGANAVRRVRRYTWTEIAKSVQDCYLAAALPEVAERTREVVG